ncbi:hypothetical protein PINS_up011507 [Pythium insidiosum]|nr:hypothetical protein PINS_up011507 [Pythium insidiosum]
MSSELLTCTRTPSSATTQRKPQNSTTLETLIEELVLAAHGAADLDAAADEMASVEDDFVSSVDQRCSSNSVDCSLLDAQPHGLHAVTERCILGLAVTLLAIATTRYFSRTP